MYLDPETLIKLGDLNLKWNFYCNWIQTKWLSNDDEAIAVLLELNTVSKEVREICPELAETYSLNLITPRFVDYFTVRLADILVSSQFNPFVNTLAEITDQLTTLFQIDIRLVKQFYETLSKVLQIDEESAKELVTYLVKQLVKNLGKQLHCDVKLTQLFKNNAQLVEQIRIDGEHDKQLVKKLFELFQIDEQLAEGLGEQLGEQFAELLQIE